MRQPIPTLHFASGCTSRIPAIRRLKFSLAALFCLMPFAGCGYHTAGSATHIPASVRTLAVPVFATHAQAYHTEMAFTQAVVRELNTRTKYHVLTSASADSDAILSGTILTQTSVPFTYALLPRAVSVHAGPQRIHPRGLACRQSPRKRLRTGPRRRYAGVVLMSAPISQISGAPSMTVLSSWVGSHIFPEAS